MKIHCICDNCGQAVSLNRIADSKRHLANYLGEYFNMSCAICSGYGEYHVNQTFAVTTQGATPLPSAGVGILVGILGGPLGMLIGGAVGGAIGAGVRSKDIDLVNRYNNSNI